MDLNLTKKVVIITGSGQGIGKTTALTFAQEGAQVVIADLDEKKGNQVAEKIADMGGSALSIKTDVCKWDDAQGMVKTVLKHFGQIDVLVNNAAVFGSNFFMKMPREDWDREISVTYVGTLNCTRAVLEHMIPRKSGCIINLGSDAGRIGESIQPVYSGAKGAVISFTKALAKDIGQYGIRVNVVSPGATMVERRLEQEARLQEEGDEAKIKAYNDKMSKMLRSYPLGKLGKPEDIANMIVFLASDKAGHITGQTISVNGGYSMI